MFSKLRATSAFIRQRKTFHSSKVLHLNRLLFDPCDVDYNSGEVPTVTIPADDYRTIHVAKILKLQNDNTVRAGIVDDCLVTDDAIISWVPEGKIKKAEPTKNWDPPGSLTIKLDKLQKASSQEEVSSRVSLILALPRPLQLSRILPMVSQLGVDKLVLTIAKKVPKDYFGSHLFRKPNELRKLLIEGLCQAGDVRIPQVKVVKRLKPFLEDELDKMFPSDEYARVIAHPARFNKKELKIRDISFPPEVKPENKKIVVCVGPEGGWEEPYELDMFQSHGFQQVTLGARTLRSDVAVVSLLSLAHDATASS